MICLVSCPQERASILYGATLNTTDATRGCSA